MEPKRSLTTIDYLFESAQKARRDSLVFISPFKEIRAWIKVHFDVSVLFMAYKKSNPQLFIVFDNVEEKRKFDALSSQHFDSIRHSSEFYLDMMRPYLRKPPEHLYVGVYDFPYLAILMLYSKSDLCEFQETLDIESVWSIRHISVYKTVLFFNDEASSRVYQSTEKKQYIAAQFYEFLKGKDEFNVLEQSRILIQIDTKDNFQNNYQSNMQYYMKDH